MANLKCDKLEEMVNDLMIDDVEEDPFSQGIQQWMNMDPLKSDAMTGYDMYPSYWYNSIPPRVVDPSPEDIANSADNIKMQRGVGIGDIVKEHALPFLSAKSLCKFRTVSKQWDQWIISPFFAHKQTVHYKNVSGLFRQLPGRCPSFISFDQAAFGIPSNSLSFLPEPVDIRSSCNGLVCCQGCDEDQAYYICNPATKDWRKLPSPKLYHGPGTAIVLAFEPSLFNFSANYELICAVNWSDLPALHFEIYSSRTGSWKISETVCCEVDALAVNGDGFYMRGIAYWETQSGSVLAFNINYEYFGIFSLPPRSGPTGALTEMHGGLCYLLPQEEYKIEVYGDMNMNLKQVITFSPQVVENMEGVCRALCFVKDDTLVLDVGGRIMAYHIRSQKAEWLTNAADAEIPKYVPYVNGLVSLAQPVAIEWD